MLIPIKNNEEWNKIIRVVLGNYDVYHLAEYHLLSKEQREGEPYLFFYSHGDHVAALPFLRRPLSNVKGLEHFKQYDATSAYGYPGLLASILPSDANAKEFKAGFQESLYNTLRDLDIITFFIRQNPLFDTSWLMESIAEVVSLGHTVALNLTLSNDEQIRQMTKGHRYDIRKAREKGVTGKEVDFYEYIDVFINIYSDTMLRSKARDFYFFSKEYYLRLKKNLGNLVKLYIAELNDIPISASIFLLSEKVVQYHLSGTLSKYLSLSGSKVIIDEVRKWASSKNMSWLHLGGGVGSNEDSLFCFKAGFSHDRFEFKIIKYVIDPVTYQQAIENSDNVKKSNLRGSDFFPLYRIPI